VETWASWACVWLPYGLFTSFLWFNLIYCNSRASQWTPDTVISLPPFWYCQSETQPGLANSYPYRDPTKIDNACKSPFCSLFQDIPVPSTHFRPSWSLARFFFHNSRHSGSCVASASFLHSICHPQKKICPPQVPSLPSRLLAFCWIKRSRFDPCHLVVGINEYFYKLGR